VEVLVNTVGGNVGSGLFVESDSGDLGRRRRPQLHDHPADDPSGAEGDGGARPRADRQHRLHRRPGRRLHAAGLFGGEERRARLHPGAGKEVGQHGITVNCVAPYGAVSDDPEAFSAGSRFNRESGFLVTAFQGVDPAEKAKRARQGVLTRSIAKPEEIAAAVVYLASDRAAFVPGQVFQVDGGTLL
jgi:hypothetical protein